MSQTPDFEAMPYAPWLEETIQEMSTHKIRSIAIAAILEDEEDATLTAYYLASMADKTVMAAHINADAMYNMVMANALSIMREAQEQEAEENGEDD